MKDEMEGSEGLRKDQKRPNDVNSQTKTGCCENEIGDSLKMKK